MSNSDRTLREQPRIDYKVYNETGRKVAKESRELKRKTESFGKLSLNMDGVKLVDNEKKVCRKIERFLDEYELDTLFDIEDVEAGITEVKRIIESYEEIHIELERELGNEYENKYIHSQEKFKLATCWIKIAKLDIKRRKTEKLNKEETEKYKKVISEKEKLKIEEKHLRKRIDQDLNNMVDEDSDFTDDLERNINRVRDFIREYSKMFVKIEDLFSNEEYVNEYAISFQNQNHKMNNFVRQMLEKVKDIKQVEIQVKEQNDSDDRLREDELRALENEMRTKEKLEKINIFNGVFENMRERALQLKAKYNISMEDLADTEILEKEKDVKILDKEFSKILDLIADLIKVSPSDYNKTEEVLNKASIGKNKLKILKEEYYENLKKEVKNRDLSSEKVKNASLLKIEVPKFHGYGSSLDFYSFKNEFEKLISPRIQAKLVPDYLKNNYLDGQALELVKEINQIDQIWERLKSSYGNVSILLNNRLGKIEKCYPLWKIKSDEKFVQVVTKLINEIKELSILAKKHDIEEILFHPSNLTKIYDLIGKKRQSEFIRKNLGKEMTVKKKWEKIINFLDDELRVKEEMVLLEKSKLEKSEFNLKPKNDEEKCKVYTTNDHNFKVATCVFCGKTDHVATVTKRGKVIINYFACPKFAEMNPMQRLSELKTKGLCCQCLTPGLKKGHDGLCFNKYNCPDEAHKKFETGYHILVCDRHKNNPHNLKLLEEYRSRYIVGSQSPYENFSKNISISFHVDSEFNNSYGVKRDKLHCEENLDFAIYMLQTILIQGKKMNLFFDSGCGDLVCKKEAVSFLSKIGKANKILDGPLTLSGVGDKKTICQHGAYNVKIPLHNGNDVNLSGICLEKITSDFPMYPLKEVEAEIHHAYASQDGDPQKLPKLPHSVGGDTDLMIGIQYLRYYPKKCFSLPNGLTIYESQFRNFDGSRGIVGGPHRVFTEIHKNFKGTHLSISAYLTDVVHTYQNGFKLSLDMSLLGQECELNVRDDFTVNTSGYENALVSKRAPKSFKKFEEVENAGTEISYRCVRCRGCADCKKGERIECISIQEEVEQTIIDKSVHVDLNKGCTIAQLPFLCDATKKLAPNKRIARKIYDGQIRKLNLSPNDKQDVILSEQKLQQLGFVDYLGNLPIDQQRKIASSPIKYFIPWRSVWNMNSKTTQCRLVFDASHPTETGVSLNNLLAKGRNNMNKLIEIVIRWQIRQYAFHTDVRKMYNTIKLDENHWCYQLYLWEDDLDPKNEPKVKVIKTLIYGVKSSGNQAERGIRETGNLMKAEYPRQNEIIHHDVYVDDCMSGESSQNQVYATSDGLKLVLNKGGFDLKGFTFSGFDPPEHLANNDQSINVAGMKWYSSDDLLSLNIGELNFAKKCRGKKLSSLEGLIPEDFTRRDCAGKVAEIFDLLGKFTPITAGLKLDLSELSKQNLEWDDNIPDDLKSTWKNNFKLIQKLGQIKFNRAVPVDAISLDIETIEMADASQNLACSAIYGRFKRKSGSYSCQLLFGKSKIIQPHMTMPRAELYAASLNAATGHVVYLALKDYIKSRIHLTDNEITLFWITNTKLQMKQWVRNRVIEINRLTSREKWFHIDSENMTADLGTRKGAKIEDVSENSLWMNGQNWATLDEKSFPIRSASQIKLSTDDLKVHNDESLIPNDEWISRQLALDYNQCFAAMSDGVLNNIGERYKFSHYVIDPNKFRFRKVVRILALVLLFIKNLRAKINANFQTLCKGVNYLPSQFKTLNDKYLVTQVKDVINTFPFNCKLGLVICLNDELLIDALNYFYEKATSEIKHFQSEKSYKNIMTEKNGIFLYTGRILPSQMFDGKPNLSDVCIDLTMSSFCVPLVEKFSPLAYALVNEVHWYDPDAKHSGNETVLRYVQKIAHIIEGRSLIKKFRTECARCRILKKKAIDVAMGPTSDYTFCIAPAFYVSQVDIFGPFSSYSNANKRASIKIWFVVFCCCTTGAVDIKLMEDYSTNSFILAFIRFSCKVGFPKKLLPDAGSQLVKGCQTMTLEFSDIKNKLLKEYGVAFETCPVGAHYVHGKVERKIRHARESFSKSMYNNRLSVIQWETLGDQVSNSINNLPIAIGNIVRDVENLDILTPNRLMLARNNARCPVGVVTVTNDPKKIIQANNKMFEIWFKCWLISYVPTLMSQPKWYDSTRDSKIGDVVLFLKSEKEFDKQYQYGIIRGIKASRDGKIREIEVEYQNHNENVKRRTNRGVRDVVVIHPVDELGTMRELNGLMSSH